MADQDATRRIARLAKRAKELDDLIARTAKMQKRIVAEISRLGINDRVKQQRAPPTIKEAPEEGAIGVVRYTRFRAIPKSVPQM